MVQAAEAIREEFFFPSADGATSIYCISWAPASERAAAPKAIVQLAHGMEEYIARYDDFARFLAGHGYAVCGNDHIGHGQSVNSPEKLSHLPLDGADAMLADMRTLRQRFAARFPEGTPYVLFGHSMGSFAARCFVARYGQGLAGAVFCGTGNVPAIASRFGGWLARRQAAKKGAGSLSPFISGMAEGSYGKKIENARTDLDWLNTDPAKVDEYIADPLCGVPFTVGGYASLMDLTAEACSKLCASSAPSGLPVLFVSGTEDPVGGNEASGVKAAYGAYAKHSETRPQIKLYDGMRHEILNEPNHQQVYDDVLAWLDEVVGQR